MSQNALFHLWIPDIFSVKGGTQTYSAFFLKAIQNIYPNSHYQVFLKNDDFAPPNHPFLPTTQFHFFGSLHPPSASPTGRGENSHPLTPSPTGRGENPHPPSPSPTGRGENPHPP
ncbi:MAG TPA: hypothetical protein V6C58_20660, partial [Allocoleopsis sp.]